MAKVIHKEIKAAELPRAWVVGLDVGPNETVRVTVDARRRRDARALLGISELASAEALRRGLTKRKLDELLDGR